MYVTDLRIQGVKLLRDFHLSFGTADSPRMWTVLIGENGRCKTSVLRALAMAASGVSRTHELADLPSLPDRREPTPLQIEATFSLLPHDAGRELPGWSGPPPDRLHSVLSMPPGLTSMKGRSWLGSADTPAPSADGDVLFEVRGRNLPRWLVAGYGTTRYLPRPHGVDSVKDPTVARLASLFDKGTLIGTGFADLLDEPQRFAALLREALVEKHVLPEALGIELRGRGGVRSAGDLVEGHRFLMKAGNRELKVPATWLSQGYQSTIAWLGDFLGHVLLEGSPSESLCDVRGLVLIDELDLHLHPAWQVRLVESLKKALPNVQFVVTTHSPMVLPGLREEEIVILDFDDDGNVVPSLAEASPMLMTGGEIYRAFFGIDRLHPNDLGRDLQRFAFLAGNGARTAAEEAEMQVLQSCLRDAGVDPGWEPVAAGAAPEQM